MASRRQYLTQAELAEYANITITDSTEADDQISQAEEIIDAYVGYQDRFIQRTFTGEVTSATSTKIIDSGSASNLSLTDDYFVGCELEIIGGTGSGQRRIISASNKTEYSITVGTAFATTPDATSYYKIYQLGKFPRHCDVYGNRSGDQYFKSIPEAVKRATAAQVEYMINQGEKFFASETIEMRREKIGNYEYERGSTSEPSQSATVRMIAPKARALLRGIKNATGRLIT